MPPLGSSAELIHRLDVSQPTSIKGVEADLWAPAQAPAERSNAAQAHAAGGSGQAGGAHPVTAGAPPELTWSPGAPLLVNWITQEFNHEILSLM